MTDNEIIKALECCIHSCCVGCPCADDDANSCNYDKKYVLDLINRQKEKIKEFDEKLVIQQGLIDYQKAEIERLKDKIFVLENDLEKTENLNDALGNDVDIKLNHIYDLEEKLKKAKPEAIKELAEELEYFVLNEDIEVVEPKCKDYESYINGANQFRHQIKNGIKNLVKEMTENYNGQK